MVSTSNFKNNCDYSNGDNCDNDDVDVDDDDDNVVVVDDDDGEDHDTGCEWTICFNIAIHNAFKLS